MSAVCAPPARRSPQITLRLASIFLSTYFVHGIPIFSRWRCVLENMGIERKDMRIICKHPPVLSRFPCVSVCVCFSGAVFFCLHRHSLFPRAAFVLPVKYCGPYITLTNGVVPAVRVCMRGCCTVLLERDAFVSYVCCWRTYPYTHATTLGMNINIYLIYI